MQIRTAGLLSIVSLACATSAGAYFEIDMKFRPGTDVAQLDTSETVTVDVFFSTDRPGMLQLSVGVTSAEVVTYDRNASLALPVIYPAPPISYGTTGAQAGYILYGIVGKGQAVAMYSVQDAPSSWPDPAPGTNRTNIPFQVGNLLQPTPGVGDDIWLASLVFHLGQGFRTTTLFLEIEGRGAVLNHPDLRQPCVCLPDDPPRITLSAPLTFQVPEPGTAMLVGLGVLLVARAGRRAPARWDRAERSKRFEDRG